MVLTPEPDDAMYGQRWQPSFNRYAPLFRAVGASVLATPWSRTPLSSDSASSFVYIANLTWGYHFVPDRWNAWLRAWPKQARIINSIKLLMWNTRKTYLRDLELAGIPVIPTLYVDHIDQAALINASEHFSTSDLVVKPVVSACSFNMVRVVTRNEDVSKAPSTSFGKTKRTISSLISFLESLSISDAVAELQRVNAVNCEMMIQPFMPSVAEDGELSVLVFGGHISHAVKKVPQPDDFRVQAQNGGIFTTIEKPTLEMVELSRRAIAACPEKPVYARVDMIRDRITGKLCVIELEIIEPDLYLDHMSDGGMAFTRAIIDYLRT